MARIKSVVPLSWVLCAVGVVGLFCLLASIGKHNATPFEIACYWTAWGAPAAGAFLGVVGLVAAPDWRAASAVGVLLNAAWLSVMVAIFCLKVL